MRPARRIALGASALAAATVPLAATAQDTAWDDATVIHAGGGTFLLDRAVDDAITGSAAMRDGMRRIGIRQACAIAATARREAVAAQSEAFLPVLVREMRALIPPERLTGRAFPAFTGTSLMAYKARVSDALQRDAAPAYASAKTDALARFETDVAAAPAIAGDWTDIFTDWDFDRANAVSSACVQYGLTNPASGKRAFDMFYQRKEVH